MRDAKSLVILDISQHPLCLAALKEHQELYQSSRGQSSFRLSLSEGWLTVLIGWVAFPEDGFNECCEKHIVSAETHHIALTVTLANSLHRRDSLDSNR